MSEIQKVDWPMEYEFNELRSNILLKFNALTNIPDHTFIRREGSVFAQGHEMHQSEPGSKNLPSLNRQLLNQFHPSLFKKCIY